MPCSYETVRLHHRRAGHTGLEIPWLFYPMPLPLYDLKESDPVVTVYRCMECGARLVRGVTQISSGHAEGMHS